MHNSFWRNKEFVIILGSFIGLAIWSISVGPEIRSQMATAELLHSVQMQPERIDQQVAESDQVVLGGEYDPAPVHIVTQSSNPNEIIHGPKDRKRVALTFDVEENPQHALSTLDVLKEKNVRTTMFIMGDWSARHEEVLERIVSDGHEIGNHSYSHLPFPKLNKGWVHSELVGTEEFVQKLTGQSTKPFFRFPYGDRTDDNIAQVNEEGYTVIKWNVDPKDWRNVPEQVYRLSTTSIPNGAIILFHLGSKSTYQVIGRIIDSLQAQGFELVTLGDMLGTGSGQ